MFALPGNLLFLQLHRMLIWKAVPRNLESDHFHHWLLSYCVLMWHASLVEQSCRVDRHLLVIGAQLLLPERFVGKFAQHMIDVNAERKFHASSINVLRVMSRYFWRTCCLVACPMVSCSMDADSI